MADCRIMETRSCPLQWEEGCKDKCMRFETSLEDSGVTEVWQEHWNIVDGKE